MPKPIAKPAEEPSKMPKPIATPKPAATPPAKKTTTQPAQKQKTAATTKKPASEKPVAKNQTATTQFPIASNAPTTEPKKLDFPYHIYKSSATFSDLEKALKTPDRVYRLDLSRKKLKSIPPEVFKFPNLMYLNLSHNRIEYLPRELKNLKGLIELNLSNNRIDTMPDELGDLSKLRFLNLSNNVRLYKFPVGIRGLKKLQNLDVTNTNILEFELNYVRRYLPECKLEF
jgi:Leucine-rich repeat (LRR) protein